MTCQLLTQNPNQQKGGNMKQLITTPAYSLKDFRLLPGFTFESCSIDKVSLKTRLCCKGGGFIFIQLPFISAAMQAVTGIEMCRALAELGGIGVLPVMDSIDTQCEKVNAVKRYKAGFQTNIITFSPSHLLAEVKSTMEKTSYSIFPVTDSGFFHGKLLGIITDKDYDPRYDLELNVNERMKKDVQVGIEVDDLKEANHLMIQYGHGFLPIVTREGTLQAVVFKKDLDKHIKHPNASVDVYKRLCVGAAVSTHPEDRQRIKELVENEVDFLVIDASDGYTQYQEQALKWIKERFDTPVIGGNVITGEAADMLLVSGADGIKVGMGIGSGCITQQVKATGRGQATALMDVVKVRDEFAKENRYVPVIADGGITTPLDVAVALALGADSVMMGNFFARFSESPGVIHNINGQQMKSYWMEASTRAKNNRRYLMGSGAFFEEGIEGFVPHLGSIYNVLPVSVRQLQSTLSTVGAATIEDFHEKAVLELQSPLSQQDSQVHSMIT